MDAAADVPDRLYAGGQGVWQLEARAAPTATPNPVRELLSNLSFEYTGVWRIPDTPYDAAYSQEQHYAGYWSMRSGITAPNDQCALVQRLQPGCHAADDRHGDAAVPALGAGERQRSGRASSPIRQLSGQLCCPASRRAATLEEFHAALEAAAGDLQYGLVIEQPSNKIHYLYKGLDNQKAWKEETFDLTGYLGKSVRLQFGTYNDGSGSAAAQYFDAFSLQVVGPSPADTNGYPAGNSHPQGPDVAALSQGRVGAPRVGRPSG